MESVLCLAVIVSFVATWIALRKWIGKAPEIGLQGFDMNKPGRPKVAEMGGICVIFGFVLGMLMYLGLRTFWLHELNYVAILGVLCTVLSMCIIGMMDDVLGWKRGLRQWQKPIFTLFAALPMMVINSGQSTMNLPIVGPMDLGILYPLLIVPLGIVGASNAYNMVAGYNGLEAGMGIIILSALGYFAFITGEQSAAILAICMVSALIAFLYFNWYPARVFPGDTLTYSLGALIACIAILGDMEKIAVVIFLPYAFDFVMQAASGFRKEAFAKVNGDGSLEKPYKGIYHLTHLALAVLKKVKHNVYERDVVLFICGLELALVGLTFYTYL
ncbi:glycosyltransferase 4 family protein [Methanothrix soehngenii]|jgi:UDP-N-acetylglucosamine--dolichyl-phosphate N-acetylglucosaminephosphotransferase|uniref:MraY family glycosyltransferase n=1 Tax=Methanothrix soehngenii TaxID=2223 RepID=UPI00300C5979